MNQRDLVWITFPYSNLEEAKARPALVVSREAYNQEHEDVLICAVTSNLRSEPYKVPISSDDLTKGELPVQSMVRADKLLQVERGLVDSSLGRVRESTHDRVVEAIHRLVSPGKEPS